MALSGILPRLERWCEALVPRSSGQVSQLTPNSSAIRAPSGQRIGFLLAGIENSSSPKMPSRGRVPRPALAFAVRLLGELDVRALNDVSPALVLGVEKPGKVLGRAFRQHQPLRLQPLADVCERESLPGLLIEIVDHRGRRVP